MGRFRRGGNPDHGDQNLVAMARKLGATITITTGVGWGFPDWVVGHRGLTILVERKNRRGKLRDSQIEFARTWAGAWYIKIENEAELVAMLTARDLPAWLDAHDLTKGERWRGNWRPV